jgi:uncharacterized protein (TIGR02271 family)
MTDETIVAIYDTEAHADAAVRDLESIAVPPSAISRHSGSSMSTHTGSGQPGTGEPGVGGPVREKGFWASLFGGDPGRDEEVYDRSLASGSSVVMVKVPDQHVQRVTDVLERHNPIDIDERAAGYGIGMGGGSTTTTTTTRTDDRLAGTDVPGLGTTETGTAATGPMGTGTAATGPMGTGPMATGVTGTGHTATGLRGGEEVIPLSEEEIAVGKRLVNRGTTRIRRFVVETPVEESVNLHSESVSVERRPVTGSTTTANPDFTDRTIEVTETDEEAVVAKSAHVREEVVINKTAADRTETVRDTVRREDVEITKDAQVDRTDDTTGGPSGGGVDPTRPRV